MGLFKTIGGDIRSVSRTFADTPRLIGPMIQWSLLFRLLNTIVLIPVGTVITGWLVASSGKSVISNYEIASVLTSPKGILLSGLLVAWFLSVTFFEEAGQLILVQAARQRRRLRLYATLRQTLGRGKDLFTLAGMFILLIAVAALPFLLIAGLLYVVLLGSYDINYYLLEQPREWKIAMASAVVLAGLFGLVAGWLVLRLFCALPVCVLDEKSALESMRWSWRNSRTNYWNIFRLVGLMVLFHIIFSAVIGLVIQAFEWSALGIAGSRLAWIVVAIATILLFDFVISNLWSLVLVTTNSLLLFHLFATRSEATDPAANAELDSEPLDENVNLPRWLTHPAVWAAGLLVGLAVAIYISHESLASIELADHTAITAHRGDVSRAPENSLSAIRKAIELGCDFVEIDVQETADGVVVLAHDADWKRIAGDSRRVWETTLAEVRTLDIGSSYSPEFAGERVPTLAEVIDVCRDRIKINIELKPSPEQKRLIPLVVDLIHEQDFADQCIISSLHFDALAEVGRLAPELPLCANISATVGNVERLEVDAMSLNFGNLDRARFERLRQRGYEVHVWTVNDPAEMNRFVEMGVDNILTDEPSQLISLIEERSQLDVVDRVLLRFQLLMR